MMPYEEFENMVVTADRMGFQIGVHAIGDKGNNWTLNAYEKAQKENGKRDSRHRDEHAQTLQLPDITSALHHSELSLQCSPHIVYPIKNSVKNESGLKELKVLMPGKALQCRCQCWHSVQIIRLNHLIRWKGLYAAVTRKDRLGEDGDGWFPEQKLTMEEAIKYYTLGSAYAQFMEDRKGMIRTGYLADIVIIDRDLLTIPEDQIMKTKVDYTITGGKIVYSSLK